MNGYDPLVLTEDQISRKAFAHILPISVFMGFMLVIPVLEFFGLAMNNRDVIRGICMHQSNGCIRFRPLFA